VTHAVQVAGAASAEHRAAGRRDGHRVRPGRSVNRAARSSPVRACSARPDRSSNSSCVSRPAWKCSLDCLTPLLGCSRGQRRI
jgi:hypothetical protein